MLTPHFQTVSLNGLHLQNSWKPQATTMRSKCTNTFSISRMSKWFSRLLQIEVCWHFDESNILILGIFDTSHWFDEKYWKFHIYLLNISDNFQFLKALSFHAQAVWGNHLIPISSAIKQRNCLLNLFYVNEIYLLYTVQLCSSFYNLSAFYKRS